VFVSVLTYAECRGESWSKGTAWWNAIKQSYCTEYSV
jgi:hypothetical protein